MNAKTRMRRISFTRDRSMNMFSPPLTEPERSSPSSRMIGGPE
jgi:hypothetical protein